ncbi:hypothetical protein [Methyloglobulus sp.]
MKSVSLILLFLGALALGILIQSLTIQSTGARLRQQGRKADSPRGNSP